MRSACGALLLLASCTFQEAVFGKPCASDIDCPGAYRCFRGEACVPNEFPDDEVPIPRNDGGPDGLDGDRCVDAITIELGTIVEGSTVSSGDDMSASCANEGAPENFYAIDLAAPTSLIARVEPAGYDAVLYATTSCSPLDVIPNSCIDTGDDNLATETLQLANVGPGTIFFVVDGAPGGLAPPFGPYRFVVDELRGCEGDTVPLAQRCIGRLGSAEMATSRTNATATLLADGRVLLAGGRSGASVTTTRSAELFDPTSGTFSDAAQMLTDRARHAAVLLGDGRVAVFGGVRGSDGNYTATANAEVYDPDADAWTALPALPSARDLFTATLLFDGGVLLVGGRAGNVTHNDVWIFDAGSYTEIVPGLAEARFSHTASLLDDGDVLIAGGRVGSASITLDRAERFDDATNSVLDAGFAFEARGGHTATILDDGSVLVAGGFQRSDPSETIALAGVDVYDPFGDEWDFVADLNQPRLFAVSAPLDVGVLLVGGDVDAPLTTVEIYLPDSDEWILLPSLATGRLAASGVALGNGTVLIAGGDGGNGIETPLTSAEIYGFAP